MPEHERRHVGRPSLLTPAVQETICAAIRRGCYATVAATRAGVDDFTTHISQFRLAYFLSIVRRRRPNCLKPGKP